MTIVKNIATVFCLSSLTLAAGSALAAPTIDCSKSKSDQAAVQGAINLASKGDTIRLTGVCEGVSLVITKSGISVIGPAELHGVADKVVLAVRDAHTVTLRDLTVSGGTIGLEVDNARVTAIDFTSEHNSQYGISSVGVGALACVNCTANNNATGLVTTGYTSLCGNSVFNDNTADGAFGFLGAQIFMMKSACGVAPTLTMNRNGLGLHLFGNTSMIAQDSTIEATQNRGIGILAYDNVVLTILRTNVDISFNGSVGLNMGASSSVRLNDSEGGSTTIANNASVGLAVGQTGQLNAQSLTLSNNTSRDLVVTGFSVAQVAGSSSLGGVYCEPDKSSGSACP
jgi:hypothetical protein